MFKVNGFKPTIVVCINDILEANVKSANKYLIKDLARGCWPIGNSERAKKCEWLIAIADGQIKGVWKIKEWWAAVPGKRFSDYLKLRPPLFDAPNCFHGVARRHLRYVCEVAAVPHDELAKCGLPASLPLGFRLYGQIGYINA